MTDLTQHFTLEEMTHTDTGLPNNITNQYDRERLQQTAELMEDVRAALGSLPIKVNSGYRARHVNAAVGGTQGSAHTHGHACDFTCDAYGNSTAICKAIVKANIKFDQLIDEGRWVHIGLSEYRRRGVVMTRNINGSYSMGLKS